MMMSAVYKEGMKRVGATELLRILPMQFLYSDFVIPTLLNGRLNGRLVDLLLQFKVIFLILVILRPHFEYIPIICYRFIRNPQRRHSNF